MVRTKRNKKIKDELRRLKEIDRHIIKLEREREHLENQLVREAGGPSKAIRKKRTRKSLVSYAYRRFRRQRLTYFVITSIGVLTLWVGGWEIIDSYHINSWALAGLGVLIIWLTRHYD